MADLPIGAAVKGVRLQRGMSQNDVARAMGCPQAYISRIENGHTLPMMDQLARLAVALRIELWRLVRHAERLQAKLEDRAA